MKKLICIHVLSCCAMVLCAQRPVLPTSAFSISGLVTPEMTVTFEDIGTYPVHEIGDFVMTNHKGEQKGIGHHLKGVLLKEILAKMEFTADKPNALRAFYFTLKGSDGYTVVMSWNELFNAPTGDQVFIVTEMNGESISEMEERILCVTTAAYQSGRRHLQGLQKIVVQKAE